MLNLGAWLTIPSEGNPRIGQTPSVESESRCISLNSL